MLGGLEPWKFNFLSINRKGNFITPTDDSSFFFQMGRWLNHQPEMVSPMKFLHDLIKLFFGRNVGGNQHLFAMGK
jgi:predicted proteasome-type protease